MFFKKKEDRSKKQEFVLTALLMLWMVSCVKDVTPTAETFKILKEKEKVTIGVDRVVIRGEYDYSGVVDSIMLRLGTEEHLFGSDDYAMSLDGKAYYVEVTGLQSSTVYYYRYVVDYGAETAWQSDIYSFITADNEINLPSAVTVSINGVSTTTASCSCTVLADGGAEVVERGACWSTDPNPSISNNHFANGAGLGEYTVDLELLEPNTTYYVRAYAKNGKGYGYGETLTFKTLEELVAPLGCDGGLFSVDGDKQVWFAQGNLRYTPATQEWGFAEAAYEIVGDDNANISENYSGQIDLFNWGTSGYDHGAVRYQPWQYEGSYEDYLAYGSEEYNLEDQTGQADWGYGVVIEEDDELTHPWRTLTQGEWNYVFMERPTSSGIRFAKAQVANVNGMLLLPDDWSTAFYALNNINQMEAGYASNRISEQDFESKLRTAGAVFLPAAGRRLVNEIEDVGAVASYWSSTARSLKYCYIMIFDNEDLSCETTIKRNKGCAVRLVRDVVRK